MHPLQRPTLICKSIADLLSIQAPNHTEKLEYRKFRKHFTINNIKPDKVLKVRPVKFKMIFLQFISYLYFIFVSNGKTAVKGWKLWKLRLRTFGSKNVFFRLLGLFFEMWILSGNFYWTRKFEGVGDGGWNLTKVLVQKDMFKSIC